MSAAARLGLTTHQAKEVITILRKNGTGSVVLGKVAKQYNIAESSVRAIAQAMEEADAKPTITETSPFTTTNASDLTSQEMRQRQKAEYLVETVNRAESRPSLAECSTEELYALAGVRLTPSRSR